MEGTRSAWISSGTREPGFGSSQSQGEYPHWPQRTHPFVWRREAPHSGHSDAVAGEPVSLHVAVSEEGSHMVRKHHRENMVASL